MKVSGWAGYPLIETKMSEISWPEDVEHILFSPSLTVRGCGRSYGDSALGKNIATTRWLNRIDHFDHKKGIVKACAGISIEELLKVTVPAGWFIPVTPGSKFVSLGGCVASDVHGKNHHIDGCFSQFICNLQIYTPKTGVINCNENEHPDLFTATCGGMGLTGIILSVTLRLKKISTTAMSQTILRTSDLQETLELFSEYQDSPYSVAWIDSLATGKKQGRAVIMLGEHCETGILEMTKASSISVPENFPSILLNSFSIKSFNSLYHFKARPRKSLVHYEPFFYPLDGINNWNRLYGEKGFVQYQFVVPYEAGIEALQNILEKISNSGFGSFLTVLKAFGEKNKNPLSFPLKGYTVALDFKISPGLFEFLDNLDLFLLDIGGRLYLTKDARMSENCFKLSYPEWEDFEDIREKYGCTGRFSSLQSLRLGLA